MQPCKSKASSWSGAVMLHVSALLALLRRRTCGSFRKFSQHVCYDFVVFSSLKKKKCIGEIVAVPPKSKLVRIVRVFVCLGRAGGISSAYGGSRSTGE